MKAKAKDAAINEQFAKIGVSSVRIPGKIIVEDVKAAADLVSNAIASENSLRTLAPIVDTDPVMRQGAVLGYPPEFA
jgi:hypothetical protein